MNSLSLLAAGIERVTNAGKNTGQQQQQQLAQDDDGNNEEEINSSDLTTSNDSAAADIDTLPHREPADNDDDDGYEDLASSEGDGDYDDELSNSSDNTEEQEGKNIQFKSDNAPQRKRSDSKVGGGRNWNRAKAGHGNKAIRFNTLSSPAATITSKSHLRRDSSNRFNLSDSEQLKTHLDSYHRRIRQKLQQKKRHRLSKSNSQQNTTSTNKSDLVSHPSTKSKNPFSLVWIWSFIRWLFISPILAFASLFSPSRYKRAAPVSDSPKPQPSSSEQATTVTAPKPSIPKPLPKKVQPDDEDEWGSSDKDGSGDEESSSLSLNEKQVRFGSLPAPHSLKSPNSGTSLLVQKRKKLLELRRRKEQAKEKNLTGDQQQQVSSSKPQPSATVNNWPGDDITSEFFSFPVSRVLIPKQAKQDKKILIMDLDETLIHSLSRETQYSGGHMIEVKLSQGHALLYYVHKRPHCDEFLAQVAKWYELVIFTASVQEYADPVIDWLDQDGSHFTQRFYRQHCSLTYDGYTKDITLVNPDLSKVIIIDNSPISYALFQHNAIPIEGWISDPTDNDLMNLLPVLYSMRYTTDIRSVLGLRFGEMG